MTLHVTNGEIAAQRLVAAGIADTVLTWDDPLHEGPLSAALDDDRLRHLRVDFLAAERFASAAELAARFEQRDRQFASWSTTDEIVLWFEHDLYDQLQLVQIAARLAAHARRPVTWVRSSTYLGSIDPAALRPMFDSRVPLTEDAAAWGETVWRALGADDPRPLQALLARPHPEWPHLTAALRRHLEELPDTKSGLSRLERQICAALEPGALLFPDLFQAAHHAVEDPIYLGDVALLARLRRMASAADPLVLHQGDYWTLTRSGAEVLAGKRDWLSRAPIDRWLGGVHLVGRRPAYRWDATRGKVRHDL